MGIKKVSRQGKPNIRNDLCVVVKEHAFFQNVALLFWPVSLNVSCFVSHLEPLLFQCKPPLILPGNQAPSASPPRLHRIHLAGYNEMIWF